MIALIISLDSRKVANRRLIIVPIITHLMLSTAHLPSSIAPSRATSSQSSTLFWEVLKLHTGNVPVATSHVTLRTLVVMAVSPDMVRRTPTLFGKNGALAPWFAALAGSIIIFFRLSLLEHLPSLYIMAALKPVPVALLFLITQRMIELEAFEPYAKMIGRGLLFCAVGDVFLELETASSDENLLLCGLVFAIGGQICYIGAYGLGARRSDLCSEVVVPVCLYGLAFVWYVHSYLSMSLLLTVSVYTIVVGTAAVASLCRPSTKGNFATYWSKSSGTVGTLLFVLSHSVLVLNKVRLSRLSGLIVSW